MATLLTGSTGFIGSYLLAGLLARSDEPLLLLVRDGSPERLWRALQLHLDIDSFRRHLDQRITILDGDLSRPRLGLGEAEYARAVRETRSVLHCAATLNRKSERACMRVNLKGTLELIQLAARAHDDHGLRRFSFVSTVAVAGTRDDETVEEDEAIDWERSDYDPYARTKKFGEHMLRTLLPDVSRTIFRPSVVLGDSTRPEVTQFDMVRAFAFLAGLWVLPLRKDDRIDIVPVDWVADTIVHLHLAARPEHEIYHLSAGESAETYDAITEALAEATGGNPPWFWPWLRAPFQWSVSKLARVTRGTALGHAAARLEVFLPYLNYNTVFDNARAVAAIGRAPAPFTRYCHALLKWSQEHGFRYPYREYPR